MKIAFIYDLAYPFVVGGGENRNYEIGKRLAEQGHEVHFFSTKCWSGKNNIIFNGIHYHGICSYKKVYNFSGKRRIIEPLIYSFALRNALNGFDFDIIDCNAFPFFPFFPTKWFADKNAVPLTVTWHEVWDRHYWFEYLGLRGLGGAVVERLVANLSRYNIAVSQPVAERLSCIGLDPENVTVIPNGVDLEAIKRAKPSEEGADIVFFGRLVKHKNIDMLLKAVSLLQSQGTQKTVAIIGNGPELERLLELVRSLDIQKNVLFLDFFAEKEELYSFLKACKVSVIPSFREGFSITTLESLACGLPVVTVQHRDNAATELIQNEKNGLVVQPNAEALAKALVLLVQNDTLRRRLSRNASASLEDFSWRKITLRILNYYKNV